MLGMIVVPQDDPTNVLTQFARHWFKLLAAGSWQEACDLLDEPSSDGVHWTPEKLQLVIEDNCGPGTHFHREHPEGFRVSDPDELGDGGRPMIFPYRDGSGYAFDHDLPLNGKWSDLTAQFEFHHRPQGYAVVLHDLHVL